MVVRMSTVVPHAEESHASDPERPILMRETFREEET